MRNVKISPLLWTGPILLILVLSEFGLDVDSYHAVANSISKYLWARSFTAGNAVNPNMKRIMWVFHSIYTHMQAHTGSH